MIELVQAAEDYLARRGAWSLPAANDAIAGEARCEAKSPRCGAAVSDAAGFPLIMRTQPAARCLRSPAVPTSPTSRSRARRRPIT